MKAGVLINLRSSRATRELKRIPLLCAQHGIEIEHFWQAEGFQDVQRALRAARKAKLDCLIVGGGDGTMTECANVFARTPTVIGVLPLGTGNSFALTLGIEPDLENAVATIARRQIVDVDLGRVNKRYFANFATIGFAAEVAEDTDHNLKRLVGPLAYFIAAVKPFFTRRGFHATIRSKKRKFTLKTQQIIIVNGRFFGNRAIDDKATNTNGKLTLFTAEGISRSEILRTYVAMGLGVHESLPEAHVVTSARFVVRTRPKQPLNIDGDPLGKTPARFSVARKALRVIVGEKFVEDAG